jgi:beta-glucanase (GH16 family)
MNIIFGNFRFFIFYIILILFACTQASLAQTRKLVWSDEFNGTTIDRSVWSFDKGPANDCVHYFTDRPENATIEGGILRIIALKESYEGYNYTSALLKTKNSVNWRYGRIEARIKLPGTNGFVPAFWMMPADDRYGWWPWSGEIDIMEHPTNQVDKIFGTVHTGAFSSFTGTAPKGSNIQIPDAESAYHIYAIEWTPEKIDFYVDDQKYFTFNNEHSGFKAWPFDRPFYIILNLAVGGGWVGNPDATTIFPAVMEVDFVRVFQYEGDMSIIGPDFLTYNSQSATYTFPTIDGASYSWSLPGHAEILSGQNTSQIQSGWNIFGGSVNADIQTHEGSYNIELPVEVSYNLLKNSGFEKGVKYWNCSIAYTADATAHLDTLNVHRGKSSLFVDVKAPATNGWDVQISQRELSIINGKQYKASFWAKTNGAASQLNAAIINTVDYTLYANNTFPVTDSWTQFEMIFTANVSVTVGFNVDLGSNAGTFYLDDFVFTTPELSNYNQLANPDFERGKDDWYFNTLFPAQANGDVSDGEYAVSIDNGGTNTWDMNLGQSTVSVEKGKEYTISFDAYAAEPRSIFAFVGKNADPWTVYSGDHFFTLSTTKQAYVYSFIMAEPSDLQARFGFDFGASSTDVYFDNVFLSEGKIPTNVNQIINQAPGYSTLYQNYPNPFYSFTTIKYYLDRPAHVSLKIFNAVGEEIITLADGFQTAGEHQVKWTPEGLAGGVYLSRLQTDDFSETKKLLLQK